MPNLNAALACAQLEQLKDFLKDKRELADAYETFFAHSNFGKFVKEPQHCRSNYWLNTVLTADGKEQRSFLKSTNEAGVMTRPVWRLMPDLAMYRHCQKDTLENARWLQERVVNLPSSVRSSKLETER